jgi:NADH-quinone oxidoreductase subunit J
MPDFLTSLLENPVSALMLRAMGILGLAAAGIYLMLPRGGLSGKRLLRLVGGALATGAMVLLVTAPVVPARTPVAAADSKAVPVSPTTILWPLADQPDVACYTFHILAFVSLASAVMMITSRNPVYSALWFAMVLLANSGLYLMQRAEFLAAATIIVYAGAIVVTFLFVIMLAQPTGAAPYDRRGREPLLSCIAGLVLASALVGSISYSSHIEAHDETATTQRPDRILSQWQLFGEPSHAGWAAPIDPPGAAEAEAAGRPMEPAHVKGLGKTLFRDHVVSVEIVALLLFAAVVGAVLISMHRIDRGAVSPTREIR